MTKPPFNDRKASLICAALTLALANATWALLAHNPPMLPTWLRIALAAQCLTITVVFAVCALRLDNLARYEHTLTTGRTKETPRG